MVKALILAAALGQAQAPQAPQAPQPTPQAPQAPQAPQTPGSSSQQSTTVVVPPPPGQAPVVVQPQERPVAVAPCPPCPEPRVVYRDRHRRNPVATVLTSALLGSVGGLALGAAVGLADGDDTSEEWREDLGWGAVIGFGVGAVGGAIVAYTDHQDTHAPVAHRSLTNRSLTPVVTLRGRF